MMKFDSINLQSHVVKHQQQNINNLNINNIDDNEQIWVLREPFKTMSKLKTVTDSPSTATTRKLKPNGHIDTNGDIHKKVYSNNRTKTNNYQPLTTPSRSTNTVNGSVKRNIADYSEMERNICAEPPASVKQSHTNGYKSPLTIIQGVPPSNNPRSSVLPTTVNGTNHYLPIIRRTEQQQQTPSKIKTTLTNRKYYTNSDHRCNSSRSLVSSPISNTSSTNSFSAASESTNVSININNNNCVSDHGTSSEGNHSRQKNYSPLDIHHYHRNNSTDLMTKSESACTILYNNDEKESNSKNTKSKSTYDIESLNYCNMTNDCAVGRKTFTIQNNTNQILLDNDNNRPLSRTKDNLNVAKTCFTPLEVVKEDECLEVEPKYMIDTKYNDNDVEHQLCQQQKNSLINIIKQRYANRTEHPASVSTTPTMPRAQSPTRRPSSTGPYDDEIYTTKMATTTTNFARGHRTRTSLPVIVRPATNKTNSLGLCFLCVGDETKKVLLPNEVTCTDTVKALFVRAFPHHLSMKYMDQDTVRIYVKDPERDLFYQLEDISDVKDRCVLKVVQLKTCALINESESPCTIDGRLSVFDNNHISTSSLTSTKPLCASIATNVKSKDQDDIYVPFTSRPILASEITYQRLSRLGRVPSSTSITGLQTTNSTRNSIDENKIATAQVAATTITTTNSRSLSEPRRRIQNNSNDKEQDRIIGSETILSHNRTTMFPEKISPKSTALPYENGYAFSRSGSTTPRLTDDDARCKMEYMEKQLESLTDFVQALSRSNETNERSNSFNNCNALFKNDGKSLRQSLYELKIKTHALKNDLNLLKRLQQTMQDNMRNQFQMASKRIQDQLLKYQIENKVERRTVETELDNYIISSAKIDRELEDLEATVEDLRNDVMSNKNCHVTMNDVESFALALSTISRSLVDLKASFPVLREKICCLGLQSTLKDDEKFLREEPERLDFTIKRCKRLTTMLYNLKRLAVGQEQKKIKVKAIVIQSSFNFDKKALNNEIESATQNSDGRLKAIEKAEKSRERRLYYANQLDSLKQLKYNDEQQHQNNENSRDSIQSFDNRSLNNSILLTSSARTSICSNQSSSTDTNNCPSPSLSFMVRQAVITPTQASTDTNMTINTNLSTSSNSSSESNNRLLINHSRSQLTSKQNKVTFSNELVTNGKKTLTNGSSYPSSRDHSQDSITTKFTQFQCSSPLVTTHMNNKRKPMPPPRVESNSHPTNKTISYQLLSSSSSSAVSSSSSTSSGSSTSQKNGYNHHQSNIKCFSTKPISLSPQECRQNGRCNSYSSSSTDTDSVISNPNISHLPSHTVTNGTNIIKRSPVSNQLLKSLPPCNGGFYTNQQSNNNKFDSIITDYSKKLMRTSVTEL